MIEKMQPKTFKLIGISFKSLADGFNRYIVGTVSRINFKLAKAEAIRRCETENRKCYVIQATPIHWAVFSTEDVRKKKRTRYFKKHLTWMEVEAKSGFIARPKK